MKNLRKKQGITLVALVVTIIVLLILAGISIQLIGGSNGILNRATKAVDQNEIAGAREQVDLKLAEWSENFYEEKYVTRNLDTEVTKQNYIKDSLGKKVSIGKYTLKNTGDYKVRLVETKRGTILGEGEINTQGGIDWSDEVTGEVEKPTPEEPVVPVAKYTVSYDGNGGAGVPTDSEEYESGAAVSVKFENIPTKEGFQFLGWATNASATSAEYTRGGTEIFTMGEGNVTLYAVWKEKVEISKSNVGEYVDLGTNLLDRTIAWSDGTKPETDWRIFYLEGENVWLIMSDYLPYEKNSIVGTTLTQYNNDYPYNWKSDKNRDDLLTQLKDGSKWKKLLPETLRDTAGVTVTGALDIETWVKAWNSDGGEHLVTRYVTSGYNAQGYLISKKGEGELATDYYVNELDSTNTLYFSQNSSKSFNFGYWLGAPSANRTNGVGIVTANGGVWDDLYDTRYYGVRPAVCLPSNLLTKEGQKWKLAGK